MLFLTERGCVYGVRESTMAHSGRLRLRGKDPLMVGLGSESAACLSRLSVLLEDYVCSPLLELAEKRAEPRSGKAGNHVPSAELAPTHGIAAVTTAVGNAGARRRGRDVIVQ